MIPKHGWILAFHCDCKVLSHSFGTQSLELSTQVPITRQWGAANRLIPKKM